MNYSIITNRIRKEIIFFTLIFIACIINPGCKSTDDEPDITNTHILRVPADFKSIKDAIVHAKDGDWIIISPGKYFESNIEINKPVTVSSEWKLKEEESLIDETIIDSGDNVLFSITASGVEISGLHIINGDHTLSISNNVTILHNHFDRNLDALSFETGSGGYVAYNLVENDRDDGLDSDIGENKNNIGSNIIIEHNTIRNSSDDGIEIRFFSNPNQNISYTISENIIMGSKNAGIQLISYDIYTGKVFNIHHNIISACKVGLGCMEGSNTSEDLTGASKMDEQIYFFNNTIVGNKMGATGGNNIIALNNVIEGNELGGFKRFGKNSALVNNLFFENGNQDYIELNDAAIKNGNVFSINPLLNITTFKPAFNSPCVNAGKDVYELNGVILLKLDPKYIIGSGPDIGAIEYDGG